MKVLNLYAGIEDGGKIKTKRYCSICMQIQSFELNRIVNHSECMICGARFGVKKKSKIKTSLHNTYHKRKKDLDNWYKNQLLELSKLTNK